MNELDIDQILYDAYWYAKKKFIKAHPTFKVKISSAKRSASQQFNLFLKGRDISTLKIISKSQVVTNCDGSTHKSKHQEGKAIDIYFIVDNKDDFTTIEYFEEFAKYIDEYDVKIVWGGSWSSIKDYPHFEL